MQYCRGCSYLHGEHDCVYACASMRGAANKTHCPNVGVFPPAFLELAPAGRIHPFSVRTTQCPSDSLERAPAGRIHSGNALPRCTAPPGPQSAWACQVARPCSSPSYQRAPRKQPGHCSPSLAVTA
eukprot:360716-Chlamydomonas_euryale.AAC.3